MNYIEHAAAVVESCIPVELRPTSRAVELYRLYALLMLTKQDDVTLGDIHDAWSTWMTAVDSSHKSLRPFDSLSESVQRQDGPFLHAVRAAARIWMTELAEDNLSDVPDGEPSAAGRSPV